MSKYVGESERGVRGVFRKARQAAPCIMFFDEIDALVPARGAGAGDSRVAERVLGEFLSELDGIQELKGVLVWPQLIDLICSIRPYSDQAASMKLSRSLCRERGSVGIFKVHLKGKPMDSGISIEALALETEAFNGAEIAQGYNRAALAAVRRAVEEMEKSGFKAERLRIGAGDLNSALEEVKSGR